MIQDRFAILGTVVGRAYHVERVVAESEFGVVYRAGHGDARLPVALKLLDVPQQSPAQQAEFLGSFRAQTEVSARFSASVPSVARLEHAAAFRAPDNRIVPYLVLEWLDGLTLEALAQQRARAGLPAIPLRKLARLLTPVARALESAHRP